MKYNGVRKNELRFTVGGLRSIIRHYTREAGVRNLEREIARVCRKVVKAAVAAPVSARDLHRPRASWSRTLGCAGSATAAPRIRTA